MRQRSTIYNLLVYKLPATALPCLADLANADWTAWGIVNSEYSRVVILTFLGNTEAEMNVQFESKTHLLKPFPFLSLSGAFSLKDFKKLY
jgi:hypothetical protein